MITKLYVKKQVKAILEKVGNYGGLFIRRMRLQMFRLWRKIKVNWQDLAIDTAIIVVSAFVGILIGGFIGLIFVINALLGA